MTALPPFADAQSGLPASAEPVVAAEQQSATLQRITEDLLARHHSAHRRERFEVWGLRIAFIVVILGAWQVISELNLIQPLLISRPTAVVTYIVDNIQTAALWDDIWSTFSAAILGVAIGSLIGMAAAVVLQMMPRTYRAVTFFVTFFNTLPRPALAPLFLVWFGLGLGGKVAVSVTAVAFVLFYTTWAGLSSVDHDLLLLANSLGMSTGQRLRHIVIPSAAPAIVAGLRLGTAMGILGVVVAEMVASYAGLGQELVKATNQFDMAGTFGVLFVMGAIAVVIDLGMSRLERRVKRGS